MVGKIEGCFNGVCSRFQGYLKEVQRVFEGRCLKEISRAIQRRLKGVLIDL